MEQQIREAKHHILWHMKHISLKILPDKLILKWQVPKGKCLSFITQHFIYLLYLQLYPHDVEGKRLYSEHILQASLLHDIHSNDEEITAF